MSKKGRTARWDWLAAALRRWWKFYFGSVVLTIILALLTAGPSQSLAFLAYARRVPLIFWPTLVVLTGSALAGLVLDARALLEQQRDPHHRRKRYLAAIAEHYRYIPLVINVDEVKGVPLPAFVYQPLRWYEDVAQATTDATAALTVGTTITTLDEVLEQRGQRALIILGWPGSGKTTLLRHHMFERAHKIVDDASAFLPVYISLPLFAPFMGDSDGVKKYLLNYESAFNTDDESVFAEHVQAAVQTGNAYLYLDGLDEVDGQYRQRVLAWIRERQKALALRGALIVGTRYTDYQRTDFISQAELPQHGYAAFAELVAQPMDPHTRQALAAGLLRALAEQFNKPRPAEEDVDSFLRLIEHEPTRAEWAANPLLFSLAAYLYVSTSARQGLELPVELPTSRVALYRQFIQTLLAKVVRARQAEGTGEGRESGVLFDTEHVLAEVAVRLYDLTNTTDADQTRIFTEAQLIGAVDATRNDLRLSHDIGKMSQWVVASGTLSVIRPQTFAFRHPTYREYLATLGHVFRLFRGSEQLAEVGALRMNAAWAEPMRMLAGVLVAVAKERPEGKSLAKAWLEDLFSVACQEATDGHMDALDMLIASLWEIPGVEAFAQTEQIDVQSMLLAWVEALLHAAQQNDRTLLERLQRLSPGVATLPDTLVQPALTRLERSLALDAPPEQQRAGAKALAGMGSFVIDLAPLLRVLRDGQDTSARIEAAHTLASIERSAQRHPGCDALRAVLSGSDTSLAALVVQGLTGVEHPDAIRLMLSAVEPARDPALRRLGALALGSVGTRTQARDALRQLSYDGDPRVAEAVLAALVGLGDDRSRLASAIEQQVRQGADVSSVLQSLLPYALRQFGFTERRIGSLDAIVPPLCDVPAGPFLMGSNKQRDVQAENNEQPQNTVPLAAFQIARYPVTVAEYACYVRATKNEPSGWQSQLSKLDHPVVNVSWDDATAYVEWLAKTTGRPWRLPTEAEWEKAARGTDGRIYPWGDQWDKTCANTDNDGPHTTTPVGSYPSGASPYGAHDMAGNVWEWTSSVYKPYPYNPAVSENLGNRKDGRVLRGGSWSNSLRIARAAYRGRDNPDVWDDSWGFRVVRGVGTEES